jgi:ribonuclease P protein component
MAGTAVPGIGTLRKRGDFLRLRKGARYRCRPCLIQSLPREDAGQDAQARFGITVTKKVGNAVERNRIKRRLREAVRQDAGVAAMPGCDYVLVANRAALDDDFATMAAELSRGLDRINRKRAIPPANQNRVNFRGRPDESGV